MQRLFNKSDTLQILQNITKGFDCDMGHYPDLRNCFAPAKSCLLVLWWTSIKPDDPQLTVENATVPLLRWPSTSCCCARLRVPPAAAPTLWTRWQASHCVACRAMITALCCCNFLLDQRSSLPPSSLFYEGCNVPVW